MAIACVERLLLAFLNRLLSIFVSETQLNFIFRVIVIMSCEELMKDSKIAKFCILKNPFFKTRTNQLAPCNSILSYADNEQQPPSEAFQNYLLFQHFYIPGMPTIPNGLAGAPPPQIRHDRPPWEVAALPPYIPGPAATFFIRHAYAVARPDALTNSEPFGEASPNEARHINHWKFFEEVSLIDQILRPFEGHRNWIVIANSVPGRDSGQCCRKYQSRNRLLAAYLEQVWELIGTPEVRELSEDVGRALPFMTDDQLMHRFEKRVKKELGRLVLRDQENLSSRRTGAERHSFNPETVVFRRDFFSALRGVLPSFSIRDAFLIVILFNRFGERRVESTASSVNQIATALETLRSPSLSILARRRQLPDERLCEAILCLLKSLGPY
eukprot:gnl/Chilomastix_cuspidata/1952.p1 GENE.gnl/Chilomastix_cuspidata/1952~~gnl/Chilomastix_cuspidata/1952.p1  ORF type:complete len:395 (+),score=44.85 gnl/Chilomastix_cuspidata/1952:36-1187(+)